MPIARYALFADDDGHWYVIPSDRRCDADNYLAEVEAYWDKDPGEEDDGPPVQPAWMQQIDGPESITCTDPKEP